MRCTAKSKQSGEQCKRHATPGRDKCAMHGGKSLAGIASPNLKHGRYSKYLPKGLLNLHDELIIDPDLLNLRESIVLVDTRIVQMLQALDQQGDPGELWLKLKKTHDKLTKATQRGDVAGGKAALEALSDLIRNGADQFRVWSQIMKLMEQRRKLAQTERRRLIDMQQMITSEQAMLLVTVLVNAVRAHVHDRAVLAAIQSDIYRGIDERKHHAAPSTADASVDDDPA